MSNAKMKFVKMGEEPCLLEVDKLVKSHVKSHIDAFPEVLKDEEARNQYHEFCRTRDSDSPVIGDKVKDIAEYWYMRRDIERYLHVWKSMLDQQDPDVSLFTL